ncbi:MULTISPECIES: reverse transcriptase domain-containing protein [Photobacterium]|uniref:reverse transcriptase domain-containing protein n=1 Tax=Photobacterium TaxID=657 RepID=UPI00076ABAA2|nr:MULTISPECIES: reverse transcriptase domain-containing protein [Photobacterium]MCD9475008.1 reverse transcriptase [Photobacterium phosphoreum]MCF2175859.1 reverse transcriptase [Photobacterium phosphoreum]
MKAYEIFKKRFSKKSLIDIYHKYIIMTPSTGIDGKKADIKFDINYEVNIIINKINNNTYTFSRYKEKLISKGSGKNPRVISIPTVRDRIVLKALHLVLKDLYPECAKTLIPQLMLEDISQQVKNERFRSYIKIDIKNFYPSINHDILLSKIKNKIRKKTLRSLLIKAITNKTGNNKPDSGVPQGLSISNILAEIYLKDVDATLNNKGFKYYRYVDDVLIFSNEINPKKTLDDIIVLFDKIDLECHDYNLIGSKTKYSRLTGTLDFLGYEITNRKLTVKKEAINKIETSIANIVTSYKYTNKLKPKYINNKLNLRITGCIFEGKRRGWLFYYSQMEDCKVLYKLDNTILNIIKKSNLTDVLIPKKFSKTFMEMKRNKLENHKYIINFDGYNIDEKRKLLAQFMDPAILLTLDDNTVDRIFSKRVRHLVKDLEEDLRENS